MLIRGGMVVTADAERKADVLVRAGKIAEVGEGIVGDDDVIDATGLLVLPGVVDPHTHLLLDTGTARTTDDFEALVDAGVTSAKVYTTYRDTIFYADDWTWYRLMERSGEAGLLVQVHAENDAIVTGKTQELLREGKSGLAYHGIARPAVAEVEAVSRGLVFSQQTGSPIYFVHLSSPGSVDLITVARDRGVAAIAE